MGDPSGPWARGEMSPTVYHERGDGLWVSTVELPGRVLRIVGPSLTDVIAEMLLTRTFCRSVVGVRFNQKGRAAVRLGSAKR